MRKDKVRGRQAKTTEDDDGISKVIDRAGELAF